MISFVLLATLMGMLAAATVAVPLWRDKSGRIAGTIGGLVIIGAAAGLYPLWSTWQWSPTDPVLTGSPDVLAMVGKLERRLRTTPDDLKGWLMLGRSYLTLERFDDAILAYDHSHRLDASSAEAALGLGEAMSLRAGGSVTPEAANLFEQALNLEPSNANALMDGGFAAAARGDNVLARSRWQKLKDMHPPPDIEQLLDARIAELGPATTPLATAAPPAVSGPEAIVVVSIVKALQERLKGDSRLFVFAREPGTNGPPLAAKRLTSGALGIPIHLSATDSMLPGHVLVAGQDVSITARVSFEGRPLPSSGDLYGELTYRVGQDGVRDLVIDRVVD